MRSRIILNHEKNEIRQYLLGLATEADEERLELRLMSDPAFSEEFDIVVDEIATQYVSGKFSGDEKTRVEQYFLRSPERRRKAQFLCELLRQISEDGNRPAPVAITEQKLVAEPEAPAVLPIKPPVTVNPGVWQRLSSWFNQPSIRRPAMSFAILLIVAGVSFWLISLNSRPTSYALVELTMSSGQRDAGPQVKKVSKQPGVDEFRFKLKLPTPAAAQYRASLSGEGGVSLPELAIDTQDAESITVRVPTDQITRGHYVIDLTEINNGEEKRLRDGYQFVVE
jgi:hypothetical protein